MTFCPTCGCPRLLHDSWGCRTRCGCGVSIIYVTPGPLGDGTPEERATLLEQGKMLDRGSDRQGESLIRAMYARVIVEQGR